MQGFANPIRSEGTFVVAPGRGLIWKAETPFPVLTVVNAAGLAQSVAGTETMRLSAARLPFMAQLYDMMAGALAGNWRALEKSFTVIRGQGSVSLKPLRSDDPTAAQISAINAKFERFVDQVEIIKPNGDFDRISFRDQELNANPLVESEAGLLK